MDWDEYFMGMAYMVAMKSKDTRSKVGAIAVDADNAILATGYNGFPRGFLDDIPERMVKPTKFQYTVHAELNLFLDAARRGVMLKGARMYVTWCPCPEICALSTIQCGIREVIVHKEAPHPESWDDRVASTKALLAEGDVVYREWSGKLVQPVIFADGVVVRNPLDEQ